MQIIKATNGYQICLSPKELAHMMIVSFIAKLFSNKNLHDKQYDSVEVKNYINKLAKYSSDSKEYEYYIALFELYYVFEKNCNFCFTLKRNYDPKINISTLEELEKYKDDPPDVIVKYERSQYPFELKRYRGKVKFKDIYTFIKNKIIDHYSGKQNYLIIMQPDRYAPIDLSIFRKIHKKLKSEKNKPGHIGISFNHNNIEMITVRVFPVVDKYTRPYSSGVDLFSEILNT